MFKRTLITLVLLNMFFLSKTYAQQVSISVNLPQLAVEPYHRPYVAVWLETTDRKGVHTFAFWAEDDDWYKDLRQWWRKIGRSNSPKYDAVSGATRKPGKYQLQWQGKLVGGAQLSAGEYVLHFEASREEGSREYLQQKISFSQGKIQNYRLIGQAEFGEIIINIK